MGLTARWAWEIKLGVFAMRRPAAPPLRFADPDFFPRRFPRLLGGFMSASGSGRRLMRDLSLDEFLPFGLDFAERTSIDSPPPVGATGIADQRHQRALGI
jgi:hypothetical protein